MKKLLLLLITSYLLVLTTAAQAQQTIRFAVGYFYPPFIYTNDAGKYVYGFDIEIARALCNVMHATCTFTQMPLAQRIQQVKNNQVDAMISAYSITPERRTEFDFAGPYFKSTMSYLVLTESPIVITPENLRGKTIGVTKGSTFNIYLSQLYGDKITIKTFEDTEALMQALDNKKINLVLLDTPAAQYWVENSSGKFKMIHSEPKNIPGDEGYGIAVNSGNVALARQFDEALLIIMNNGTYDTIKKRYF